MFPTIPLGWPIVDSEGKIDIVFRQRWEELRNAAGRVAAAGMVTKANQTAGLVSQLVYTVITAGQYRASFTARRTVADGVSSALTIAWHWTDGGIPQTKTETINNTDTTGSLYSESRLFPCDANTNITADVTYDSNTPAKMTYTATFVVESIVAA